MTPAPVDLPTIWRGADYDAIFFYWKDQNGNPFVFSTGWQFFAQTDQFDLNGVIFNAAAGITSLGLNNLQTAPFKLGVQNWNCWFVLPSGEITPPFLAGKVPVREKNSYP
jgi:hypothetical protein